VDGAILCSGWRHVRRIEMRDCRWRHWMDMVETSDVDVTVMGTASTEVSLWIAVCCSVLQCDAV